MANTTRSRRGGVANRSGGLVQADQVTILGDGSRARPLRVGDPARGGALVVADEGVPVSRRPRRTLNLVGPGVSARDRGGDADAIDLYVPGGTFLSRDGVAVPGGPHGVLDFVGDVHVEDAGNGAARVAVGRGADPGGAAIFTWVTIDVVRTSHARHFFAPGFAPATSADRPIPIIAPIGGVLRGLSAIHNAADGDGGPISYAVMVGGITTPLSVTSPTGPAGFGILVRNTDTQVAIDAGALIYLFAQRDGDFVGSNFLDVSISLALVAA